jgi:type IV fimbrial biogenesis protein FimT
MLETINPGAMMKCTASRKTAGPAGFTLIELIITIMIAAVLATLAAPSFREYIGNQRIRNASFDLMATLSFARGEAITRNVAVDVVPVNAENWANGWSVAIGGTTLRTQSAYSDLSITDPADPAKLTYGNDGRPSVAFTATIALPTPVSGVASRCIRIGLGGTANSAVGAC